MKRSGQSMMFRSLRHRNARVFFFGLMVSNIGSWMQATATLLVVDRLTGRGTDLGITLLFQFLPMLLLGAWAGALADRVNKRKMAVITQAGLALQALLLGVLSLLGVLNLPVIYALSLTLGILGALDNPARRGFVLELVEEEDISNVIALNTAVMTGSRVFGPALAAVLLQVMEPGWLFLLNGVTFVAILVPLVTVNTGELNPGPRAVRGGTPVRDGLRYVASNRRLLLIFIVFTVVGTFSFNYSVSLLKLADQRFGDERLFGWLLAVTGIGSMCGALITAAQRRVGSWWFFGSAFILGISGLVVAWAPSIWVAFAAGLPMGAGGAALIASLNAISQQDSPPDMRGRLLALGAVAFLGTTPIGAPATGWVADHIGAEWSLAYGSVVALLATAIGGAMRWRLQKVPTAEHVAAPLVVDHADRGGVIVQDIADLGR